MKATRLAIPDVIFFAPEVYGVSRGFFFESFNQVVSIQATQLSTHFVQDNHTVSSKRGLRGLCYRLPPKAQGKILRIIKGEVLDAAADICKNSKSIGRWGVDVLYAKIKKQSLIPEGFVHGFLTISEANESPNKTTNYYATEYERSITWDDRSIVKDGFADVL